MQELVVPGQAPNFVAITRRLVPWMVFGIQLGIGVHGAITSEGGVLPFIFTVIRDYTLSISPE
jgi:hypothetical protein